MACPGNDSRAPEICALPTIRVCPVIDTQGIETVIARVKIDATGYLKV